MKYTNRIISFLTRQYGSLTAAAEASGYKRRQFGAFANSRYPMNKAAELAVFGAAVMCIMAKNPEVQEVIDDALMRECD